MTTTQGSNRTQPGSTTPSAGDRPSPTRQASYEAEQTTGWLGWIAFAGVMMLLMGTFHAIQGLVALFQDTYYLVAESGLIVQADYTTWGWVHLILGVVVVLAGIALLAGQMWARVVAVILAFGSALVNIAFLGAYPLWSMIMIAVDVLVIYAVTVHGKEAKALKA
jgi:vacuolar-type H+-ATPase subunit I/STV1